MMILTPTRSNQGAKRWNTAAGPNLVPMGLAGYHASQTATFYLDDMYFARGAASSNPTGPAATIFSQCSLSGQTTPVACGQATSGAIGLSGSAGATNTVNITAVDPNLIILTQQMRITARLLGLQQAPHQRYRRCDRLVRVAQALASPASTRPACSV